MHNVMDITQRKRMEQKTVLQNRLLKKIAWQQSHKVRGPVCRLLGIVNLIESDNVKLSEEEQKALFSTIRKEASAIDKIIHEIVENTILDGEE